jgi:mono/diheme cytochrome c family protein
MMKSLLLPVSAICLLSCSLLSCSVTGPDAAEDKNFAAARLMLETNCVRCHGDNRLSTMPSIHDTRALSRLITAGNWIVPGQPEKSRFFQVVTYPDTIPGAMPPTGHAISKAEVETLRAWIKAGAPVPKAKLFLKPRGTMPRSV